MTQDSLHRYLFEDYQLRGELVQLQQSYQTIIEQHDYPQALKHLLGELLAATSLLTATLKFQGDITVQLQGEGPLSFASVSGNERQELRATAAWEGDVDKLDFAKLIGKGQLVITITPIHGERYQGVVAIDPQGVAATLEDYFEQSEQLPTKIWLHVGQQDGKAHAAGLFLQALPSHEDDKDGHFEHISKLSETVTAAELFSLDAETVLYRLYNQEKVSLFEPQTVCFKCTCSQARSEAALLNVDQEELNNICRERGSIDMHCDYCGAHYSFNQADIENIFNAQLSTSSDKIH